MPGCEPTWHLGRVLAAFDSPARHRAAAHPFPDPRTLHRPGGANAGYFRVIPLSQILVCFFLVRVPAHPSRAMATAIAPRADSRGGSMDRLCVAGLARRRP